MWLVGRNKRFLNLTVGAPGSTHDARFLRNTGLFKQILNVQGRKLNSLFSPILARQIWQDSFSHYRRLSFP